MHIERASWIDESFAAEKLRHKAYDALGLRGAYSIKDGLRFSGLLTHQVFLAQSFGVSEVVLLRSLKQFPAWRPLLLSTIAARHLRLIREQAMKRLSDLMSPGVIESDVPFQIFLEEVVDEEYSQYCAGKSYQGSGETLYSPLCLRLLGKSKSYALFVDHSEPSAKIKSAVGNDKVFSNIDGLSILVALYAPGKLCEINARAKFSWRNQGITLKKLYKNIEKKKII